MAREPLELRNLVQVSDKRPLEWHAVDQFDNQIVIKWDGFWARVFQSGVQIEAVHWDWTIPEDDKILSNLLMMTGMRVKK